MEALKTEKIKYNELPMISFRWVRVNDLKLIPIHPEVLKEPKDVIKSGRDLVKPLDHETLKTYLGDYQGTNQSELDFVSQQAPLRLLAESSPNQDLVHLKLDLTGGDNLAMVMAHQVKAGETLNVLLEINGDESAELATVLNLISVAAGGTLNLTKVNRLALNTRHIEQRIAQVAEGGKVNYVSVELGGKDTVIHYETNLNGLESEGHLKSFYVGNQDRVLDLSHHMKHHGQRTLCDMDVRGALTDRAKKYFRGTLDFMKGSSGSEGGEVDTVMLLDPRVKSFSIPLLLCGEDDVIGNHAASAGQIDEDKLFYLMSRGFSRDESERIIVESSFRPIIDNLPVEELKDLVLQDVARLMKKVTPSES